MKKSEPFSELPKSLVAAKAEFPSFIKTGEAKIKPKDSAGYEFMYLELCDILDIITPILAKNKLTIYQEPVTTNDTVSVTTWIFHASGEWLESEPFNLPFVKGNSAQKVITTIGQLVTFGRRYQLQPILGIAGRENEEEGLDGEPATLNSTMKPPKQKEKPKTKPEPEKDPFVDDVPESKSEPEPESEPKPKKSKQETVEQDLFGSKPEPAAEKPKAKAGKNPERQKLVDEIGTLVQNDYFKAKDKTSLHEKIGQADTIEKLTQLKDQTEIIVSVADIMKSEIFTDAERGMMRKNFTEAKNLSELRDLKSQTEFVLNTRNEKNKEKEIH